MAPGGDMPATGNKRKGTVDVNAEILCPVCGTHGDNSVRYHRGRVPVINNVTYDTAESAIASPTGCIDLVQCPECGMTFNRSFFERLTDYNAAYNNARDASGVYSKHMEQVAGFCRSFTGSSDCVLEVGCGNGDFLKCLCDTTGCTGIGYDTAYGGEKTYRGRLRFHSRYYQPEHAPQKWDVLIIRHVLEHIRKPHEFLSFLTHAPGMRAGARLFVEVPDRDWIFDHEAYYDITYEHCNYFCETSLLNLLYRTGWEVSSIDRMFNGQFLAASAIYRGNHATERACPDPSPATLPATDFSRTRKRLRELISRPGQTVVWGASGKGTILLSDLSGKDLEKINYVIDIDPGKQGRFLPVSGKRVEPPQVLWGKEKILTLVMNGIYRDEISRQLKDMGVEASIAVA
jgi:hypothetical protein